MLLVRCVPSIVKSLKGFHYPTKSVRQGAGPKPSPGVENQYDRLADFVDEAAYAEHNPLRGDGVIALQSALKASDGTQRLIDYQRIHRVLAEGSFVLCVSEGRLAGAHSAFYDLFRVNDEKIVEHWDTCEKIAPESAWKNKNGKF